MSWLLSPGVRRAAAVVCSSWLLGAATLAWAQQPAAPGDETILFADGDVQVTLLELETLLAGAPPPVREQLVADEAALRGMLEQIATNKRMAAEAERRGLATRADVAERLAAARRKLLAAVLYEEVRASTELPDFEQLARERYQVRPEAFEQEERFRIAHILRKVRADCEREPQLAVIEELRERLDAGEGFAELAAEYSEASSAEYGGDAGQWFERDGLLPEIAEAVVALPDGGVSDVVETPRGFHLVKRIESLPASIRPFEEVQAELEREARDEYLNRVLSQAQKPFLPSAQAQFNAEALGQWQAGQ